MRYMGSKRRIAKYLLTIMLRDRKKRLYVEPFVGGANVIDKVGYGKRIGADINFYLIELLKALQRGWIPPDTLDKKEYLNIKQNKSHYPPELVGFAGIGCSFASKWFAGLFTGKNGRDYVKEVKEDLLRQAPRLKGIDFIHSDYQDLILDTPSLIYCDPPYEGTTSYKDPFNHELFYNWCRGKVKEGHIIYLSEYSAPSDFKLIIEIDHATNFKNLNKTKDGEMRRIERLYKLC